MQTQAQMLTKCVAGILVRLQLLRSLWSGTIVFILTQQFMQTHNTGRAEGMLMDEEWTVKEKWVKNGQLCVAAYRFHLLAWLEQEKTVL